MEEAAGVAGGRAGERSCDERADWREGVCECCRRPGQAQAPPAVVDPATAADSATP